MMNIGKLSVSVDREKLMKAIRTEISIMKAMSHPHIVKIQEALEDGESDKIYLIMEYCSKGPLMSEGYWKAEQEFVDLDKRFLFGVNNRLSVDKAKKQAALAIQYSRVSLK